MVRANCSPYKPRSGARFPGWLVPLVLFLSVTAGSAAGERKITFSFDERSILKIGKESFDLRTDLGVEKLARRADALLTSEPGPLEQASNRDPEQPITKRDARGLKQVSRLAREYSIEQAEAGRAALRQQILEIASAIANNHRPSVPPYVGLPDFPFRLAAALSNPVCRGRKPASNISLPANATDLSAIDPQKSSYWRRPNRITQSDLFTGFDRNELPRSDNVIWGYTGAKRSGRNPGCDLIQGSQRVRAKFAEVHTEPFNSRIFHALGYHVDPADFVPQLRIRYDRRWFTEFNMLPEIKMKIGVFFVPIYTFHFEETYDPFAFIDHAEMKDGRRIPGSDLKKLLLREPERKYAELIPENFRTEVESQVELLVTIPANIQTDHSGSKNIGPWDFSGLGREHLREVRGAGMLAAWLGWWDSRFENTRLRLVKTGTSEELQHFFSDLGNGLGRSGGTFWHSSEAPNEFTWSFTGGKLVRSNGKATWRFEIKDFEPLMETPAFKEITLDDARWMARLIAQLSPEQIAGALIASGFASAEVRIYSEKLLARRDQLIRDVRLENEFPLLRSGKKKQELDYDPVAEGPATVRTKSGAQVHAPIGVNIVRRGRVEPRSKTARHE